MRKNQLFAALFISSLLLWSTSTFSMLRLMSQQRRQDRMQAIHKIDREIKEIHDEAYLNCLQEMANITGEPVNKLKEHFDNERKLTETVLKKPNPYTTHDPNMPAASYQKWQTIMHSEGINSQSTNMLYEQKAQGVSIVAQAGCPIFADSRILFPPTIIEHPILSRLPEETQEFARRHECKHVKLQHLSMRVITSSINPNAEPERLVSAQEIEADLHAASVSSKIACTGAFMQCNFGHADIIDQNKHCLDMIYMCALMKHKEELLS